MLEISPTTGYFFPGAEYLHSDIYPAISAAETHSLKQPGKVVLITGAGRGIGRAAAIQYAHADAASVVLVARTAPQLDEVETELKKIKPDIRVHKFALDVTDDAAVAQCAEEVSKTENRLDVLINNAGTSAPWVPISEGDPSKYWASITINFKGAYLFLHSFLPLMVRTAKEHGTTPTVINMSAIGSHLIVPGLSNYGISKVALNTLAQFVDCEFADKGIQAFALHPGGVNTELTKSDETFIKGLKNRLSDTAELAGGFCVWLSATEKKWLSGRYLAAPWDVTRLLELKDEITAGDKLKSRLVI